MKKKLLDFDELCEALRQDDFEVSVRELEGEARMAHFVSYEIEGEIATAPLLADEVPRLAADHFTCYVEFADCPLVMRLPLDYRTLKRHFASLGSEDGKRRSKNRDHAPGDPWPYEM